MAAIVASLVLFASTLPVIMTARHLDVSPNGWCIVDVKYPQIRGIAPASLESTINAGLRRRFLDYPESRYPYQTFVESSASHPTMADCEERMRPSIDDLERLGQTPKTYQAFENRTRFGVGFESATFVSLVGDGVEVSARQAYPNTYWWTANVDIATGHFLRFDDIFRTDSGHRKRLDNLIYESLRRDWSGSSPDLAGMFKTEMEERGDLQPALCPGGIRFFSIFHPHVVAAATTFVSGHDLLAAGVVKDQVAIAVLKEFRRANDACGAL